MAKIAVLSDQIINQIAAGEVVERPASVIKELVENSIDAGARSVRVDIELGGRRLIKITDDGEGMTRDDAVLAFERHATSKLRTFEELLGIGTLGFRGEALASISSVAKIELTTKTENDEVATRVLIEGGKLVDVRDAARERGTTIAVRDLFFNTPARRKFMRSEATENYHLTNIFTHYALAHPEIAFTLTNNGRETVRATPAKDLRERAYQLFGGQIIESLLPVSGGREYIANISGFVSTPRERRSNRDSQYFFINGRFVRDKVISMGLQEGFRAVLPHGSYPVAFLFLDIPADELDVNVHPAKTEVRFRRTDAVKEVIAEAVKTALSSSNIAVAAEVETSRAMPQENQIPERNFTPQEPPPRFDQERFNFAEPVPPQIFEDDLSQPTSTDFEEIAQARFEEAPENVTPFQEAPTEQTAVAETFSAFPPFDSAERFVKSAEPEALDQSSIKIVGQLHESFIIATDADGLLLIDQHVAHERILFDKFRKREAQRGLESQNLLLPETFDLSPAQAEFFGEIEPILENLGFGVMRLSGWTIAVKSIPADLPVKESRNLILEILASSSANKTPGARENMRDDIAASLACKAAVKINMPLTQEKMRWLVENLAGTSSPTTCPHGRPVILQLKMRDIERGFHRT